MRFVYPTMMALLLSASIAAKPFSPSMTGEYLVRKFFGPPNQPNYPVTAYDSIDRERTRGYINGIKDSTEGKLWCYTGNADEIEVNMNLVHQISKLSENELKGSAGPLILRQLAQQYPCGGQK